ncbi:MAG: metal ABC transporter substrate-binding protein [Sulfurimonas sp.]|uniref:metal ABC transporter substrate-binding protein n=1 Tax=Sulfurimonas sp. TaxID=2022749 RepID=UPI0025F8D6D8|nr:metal ABC transporter substrate-binding protein [Sulfurimonas sp.]MCK9455496.1 metal ABC transporter substrate-binding protein [Sulfurimonas sp.]
MNFKNRLLIIILLFVSLPYVYAKNLDKKPTIATSTFSLYDISKNIVGDSADTFMILPFGVDAHSYEPTPRDVVKILKSDLTLYNGASLEPWIDGFEFKNRALNVSRYVKLIEVCEDEDHSGHHDTHHKHGSVDPHYWQDPQNMMLATEQITKELILLFPNNRALYEKNRDTYIKMLKKLDQEYRESLLACELDTIIVNHNAFSYLSKRYNFNVEALSGLSPEAQPSGKNMIKLIEHVREHKTPVIFFESFLSDKAMKSIAQEANVEVDVLQPLGNITADEARENLSYEEIMRRNLKKIAKALKCR